MSDTTTAAIISRPFRVGDRVWILAPADAVEEQTKRFVGTLGTVRGFDDGGDPFVEPDAAPDFAHSWHYRPAYLALADTLRPESKTAAVVPDAVPILSATADCASAHWLTIPVPNGWDDVKTWAGRVLEYAGRRYAYSGWNSDRNVAYFRTGLPVARVV